ncbi:MAG: ABC transporter ATP-binding protein [Gemmatimonadota bacterium]
MIELSGLASRAGAFELRDISATIPAGAWGIVLGAAGAGKTTLLETIAGVRPITAGSVRLRGLDVTRLEIEHRRVGFVYQHSYLFPHLTVAENIGYGAHDDGAVQSLIERFGAGTLTSRSVSSLSGGERQLIALLRALAPSPDILLLDEPFAALDPRGRVRIRSELRRWQRERTATVLHVTHDLIEAATLGDVAMMLSAGRLSQSGTPEALFRRPATREMAEFAGAENVFSGHVTRAESTTGSEVSTLIFRGEGIELLGVGDHPGGAAHAVVRAEDIALAGTPSSSGSARNVLDGRVIEVARDGVLARVTVAVGVTMLTAVVTRDAATELGIVADQRVLAVIKATAVHLC